MNSLFLQLASIVWFIFRSLPKFYSTEEHHLEGKFSLFLVLPGSLTAHSWKVTGTQKETYHLPTIIFTGRAVKLRECIFSIWFWFVFRGILSICSKSFSLKNIQKLNTLGSHPPTNKKPKDLLSLLHRPIQFGSIWVGSEILACKNLVKISWESCKS